MQDGGLWLRFTANRYLPSANRFLGFRKISMFIVQ